MIITNRICRGIRILSGYVSSPGQLFESWGRMLWLPAFVILALVSVTEPVAGAGGWQDIERLTCQEDLSYFPPNNGKCIAVDHDGNVHVVWADERDRNEEIYHAVRANGIWSEPERLTSNRERSARPVLAVDAIGRVHLVWNDSRDGNREIYHMIWTGSWGEPGRVSDTAGDSFGSSVVSDSIFIHLVYHEMVSGNLEIMYRRYDGFSWSDALALTDVHSNDRCVPSIDTAPDRSLHVVWWDKREDPPGDDSGKIYYRKREDGWLAEELVSGPDADAMRPSVAVDDSGHVHVCWIDRRTSYEQIYYAGRGPEGWEEETAITTQNTTHYHPSLASSGEVIHLVYWADIPSQQNSGLFYRSLTGGAWSGPLRISGSGSDASFGCIIARPNRNLHAGWVDEQDGNMEIYHREYIDPANGIDDPDEPDSPRPVPGRLEIICRPNPFRSQATIRVSHPPGRLVRVGIYDVLGRPLRRMEKISTSGTHCMFSWDGMDGRGSRVAPGIYMVRAGAGKLRGCAKLIYIR